MESISKEQLVAFLKTQSEGLSAFDRFKIVNRPRICPLEDLLGLLPEGQRVLDIGCGRGTFLSIIAHYRAPLALFGIEIDTVAVESAREMLGQFGVSNQFKIKTYDGMTLPMETADFDFIFMVDVLHHIPFQRQKSFLERIFKNMRVGATFVLKDMNASDRLLTLFNKLHDLVVAREIGHEITATQAKKWLNEIGFQTSSIQRRLMYVYSHYTIIAKKV